MLQKGAALEEARSILAEADAETNFTKKQLLVAVAQTTALISIAEALHGIEKMMSM